MKNKGMEKQEIRRLRLAQLIASKKYKTQAKFVFETGYNQGEISALLKNKSFGEKKARKIELDCGLESGWLDRLEHETQQVAELRNDEVELLNRYRKLPEPSKMTILAVIGSMQKAIEENEPEKKYK